MRLDCSKHFVAGDSERTHVLFRLTNGSRRFLVSVHVECDFPVLSGSPVRGVPRTFNEQVEGCVITPDSGTIDEAFDDVVPPGLERLIAVARQYVESVFCTEPALIPSPMSEEEWLVRGSQENPPEGDEL